MSNNEKQNIYNVTFNAKYETPIKIGNNLPHISYIQGGKPKSRKFGAKLIKTYLKQGIEGEITINELLNIGESIRNYLNIFKEPFVEIQPHKDIEIYEWQDDKGIRFRVCVKWMEFAESPCPDCSIANRVIYSFCSDRNMKERMQFKNPKVEDFFMEQQQESKERSLFYLCTQLSILLSHIDNANIDVFRLYEKYKKSFKSKKSCKNANKEIDTQSIAIGAKDEKGVFEAVRVTANKG